MFINIKDNQDAYIAPYFEQTNAFIKQALENQSNLFVHCKGGMSRSPTILSAYLMSTYGKTFEEIYAFLRRKRTVVGINPNFQQQLRDYNVKLHGGVVEERPKQETKKGDQM